MRLVALLGILLAPGSGLEVRMGVVVESWPNGCQGARGIAPWFSPTAPGGRF
jgi:hypothetical protein